jgi:hypothetical protein
MNNIRIETDNLPTYMFPVHPMDTDGGINPFAFTLVQAKEDNQWVPRWLIVDADGISLGRLEADSFDDLDPAIVAKLAADFVLELHGIDGASVEMAQLFSTSLG